MSGVLWRVAEIEPDAACLGFDRSHLLSCVRPSLKRLPERVCGMDRLFGRHFKISADAAQKDGPKHLRKLEGPCPLPVPNEQRAEAKSVNVASGDIGGGVA
jgi:hypothetical protein